MHASLKCLSVAGIGANTETITNTHIYENMDRNTKVLASLKCLYKTCSIHAEKPSNALGLPLQVHTKLCMYQPSCFKITTYQYVAESHNFVWLASVPHVHGNLITAPTEMEQCPSACEVDTQREAA